MYSEHSQAPMSLTSSLPWTSQKAQTLNLPATLIVAAEGAHNDSTDSQLNDPSLDFVLDGSFDMGQYLRISNNSHNNSHQQEINNHSLLIEPSINIETWNGVEQLLDLDPEFIQNLQADSLLEHVEVNMQSLAEPFHIGQMSQEFQNLLDAIGIEATEDVVNSPSAEITYSNFEMNQLTSQDQEMTTSSLDFMNPFLASVKSSDETTLWSSEDDAFSSATPSVDQKIQRVRSSGSVTKVSKSKKESNKAAAERYRNKKQQEKLELFAECERHEKRNIELKAEIEEVQTERDLLKNLLVEALMSSKK